MSPNRFASISAHLTLVLCLFSLLSWASFSQVFVLLGVAPWLFLPPLSTVGLGALAVSLRGHAHPGLRGQALAGAIVAALLALLVLSQYWLGINLGFERFLFDEPVLKALVGPHPGRPAMLVAISQLLLALALILALRQRSARFDDVDTCAVVVLVLAFGATLGYLFQADSLVDIGRSSLHTPLQLPEVLLLILLSLGTLSLNPRGAVASLGDSGISGAAKRRLIPAAVLIPILIGMLQALALRAELLDPILAVAITSTAGIFASLFLIEWVSGLLMEREAEQTGVLQQRELQAREQGMTDVLTGLLNRRGWDQNVQTLEDHYRRHGGNACVVVIDLDGLKRVNDTEGHAAGDVLIRKAGQALQLAGRQEDLIARLGGDEFAYLSVDCQPQHAGIVMRRLTQSMERAGVEASLGSAMRDLCGSLQAAFKEADSAMYADKRQRKLVARQA
ncbi:MAG TPA: GGDEF domain-containing protein [Solimonas sp.]|nr:GGDEF domain-containing protein [Solimonas sp.]